jgi:CheY-like chemotaxis protein
MKTKHLWIALAGVLSLVSAANAADKKHLGGPRGGRLLEKTEPKAEFFLEKDRTATILFYDAALKPVPAAAQVATVVADATDGKQTIEFEKQGDVLVSKGKLPEGDGYNVVVQLRARADAKPQNLRFKLETHICGGCQRAEYGCTCDE